MVDISITPANVVKGTDAVVQSGIAGATILAGQSVARDVDGLIKLYDSDSASSNIRTLLGVALHGASANQPIQFQTGGNITIGGTVVTGTVYLGSDTAGGIRPAVDLNSGDFTSVLGIAISAAAIKIGIVNGGVAF